MTSKQLYLPEAFAFHSITVVGSLWLLLSCWLLLINLATFLVFGLDKHKAKRKVHDDAIRRIPEKTLFLLSALGGSLGALLGMRVFHHKTRHASFRFGIPSILAVQLLITLGLWLFLNK